MQPSIGDHNTSQLSETYDKTKHFYQDTFAHMLHGTELWEFTFLMKVL